MAINSENKDMLVGLSKNLIKKEADNIKNKIDNISASIDPKEFGEIITECEKSVAEIDSRIEQLKKFLKPDPGTSN